MLTKEAAEQIVNRGVKLLDDLHPRWIENFRYNPIFTIFYDENCSRCVADIALKGYVDTDNPYLNHYDGFQLIVRKLKPPWDTRKYGFLCDNADDEEVLLQAWRAKIKQLLKERKKKRAKDSKKAVPA